MDLRSPHSTLTRPPSFDATVQRAHPAMHVAVEATRLLREVRGIGRYVRALLPRLLEHRPGLRLTLFAKNRGDAETLRHVMAANPAFDGRLDVRPVREMTKSRADLFWYPWNHAHPIPALGAVVPTIHDVVPLVNPDPRLLAWQKNLRWRRRYARTAKRATLIIADSQFTADEVHRMLGVSYDRMRVVLLAADDFSTPPASLDVGTLERLGVTRPYVLAVGAADRRKNLGLLERAMPRVVGALPEATLVLAGPRRDANGTDINSPWSRTLGFVSDAELAILYRNAEVLVQPSTYEGFGLPVLEAMQLGTPVISTRASSLPEVGGDAAIWIDPQDDAALADNIIRVMTDEALNRSMRAASIAQSARFNWASTALMTLAVFEEAVLMAAASR